MTDNTLTLFLNHDLFSNIALNKLLPFLSQYKTHIIFSQKVGSPKERIKVLNHCEHDYPLLTLFPQLEQQSLTPENNHHIPKRFLTFKEIEHFYNIPCHYLSNINSSDNLAFFKNLNPDLALSIRYGHIFHEEAISIPKYGILNLHSGPIPKYRGILATFWGMLHDESTIGTTVHWINTPHIDAGPIIAKTSFPVDKQKSLLWHVHHIYNDGITELINTATRVLQGYSISGTPLSTHTPQPYFTYPTPQDVQKFLDKNYILVKDSEYMQIMKQYSHEK